MLVKRTLAKSTENIPRKTCRSEMAPSVSISEMASAELKEDILELCLVVTLGFLVLIIALCNLFVRRV